MRIEGSRTFGSSTIPNLVDELAARTHLSGRCEQGGKKVEFSACQVDGLASQRHLSSYEVDLEGTGDERGPSRSCSCLSW
jgi:hypothetical protein